MRFFSFSITNSNFSGFYLQTHYLASGWIVGMFVGWIFFKYENIEMGPVSKTLVLNLTKFFNYNAILHCSSSLFQFSVVLCS